MKVSSDVILSHSASEGNIATNLPAAASMSAVSDLTGCVEAAAARQSDASVVRRLRSRPPCLYAHSPPEGLLGTHFPGRTANFRPTDHTDRPWESYHTQAVVIAGRTQLSA